MSYEIIAPPSNPVNGKFFGIVFKDGKAVVPNKPPHAVIKWLNKRYFVIKEIPREIKEIPKIVKKEDK